jgi:hypothetical protein
MSEDVFDRLDEYDVDVPPAAADTAPRKKSPKPKRKPFGMLTLEAAKKLGNRGDICTIIHLAHHMALGKDKPVAATALKTGCNDQRARLRALRIMESLGLAEIEWRGNGLAPLVISWDVADE